MKGLRESVERAELLGIKTRAIVVLNPGNPTGAVLTEENLRQILLYAREKHMVVLADEVYQTNIYRPEQSPFVSMRRVLKQNEADLKGLELVSFNSISKGYFGECGIRGGYFQLENFHPDAKAQILKLASMNLCANTLGQVFVDLMVKPPKPGEASYESFIEQHDAILSSLGRRAKMITEGLNELVGCSCQPVVSSMYAFPRIVLPPGAVEEAKKQGRQPDELYAFSLLEATGLCVVPGSGFGQESGTFHIRITILPEEAQFKDILQKFATHHKSFIQKYGTPEWIKEQEEIKAKSKQ